MNRPLAPPSSEPFSHHLGPPTDAPPTDHGAMPPTTTLSVDPAGLPTAEQPPAHKRPWAALVVTAAIAAVVAALVSIPVARSVAPATLAAAPVATAPVANADPASDPDARTTVSAVASAVSPAVAYVEVATRRGQASGSAVIISSDGALVTNAHVVDRADTVSVTLPDGTSYAAEVVGTDTTSDLAVLQVDASGLPAVELDDTVEVGETVVAIGSPFGLTGSVTSGIISATDRSIPGDGTTLVGMIQTDAAINPGNSGGALVDTDGNLVGVPTAIYSATGSSSGIGFAVPAATIASVTERLLAGQAVTYPQLGVSGSDVTAAVAEAYDLSSTQGALVAEVVPGSGAAAAGLQAGDVIVAVNDREIRSMTMLTATIRAHRPGDVITLTVVRDEGQQRLDATLGEAS